MLVKFFFKNAYRQTIGKEAIQAKKRRKQRIQKHGKSWHDKILDFLFPNAH